MTLLTLVRHCVRTTTARTSRAVLALVTDVGPDGAILATGLLLLAYGAYLVFPPAGFALPGAILVWITLPARPAFVIRPAAMKRSKESV